MTEDADKMQKSTLDAWLSRKKKVVSPRGITPVPEGEQLLVSHGQERLWLLEQLYPDQNLYHYAHRYRFQGRVNLSLLIESFQQLARNHEIIRSNYKLDSENLIQFSRDEPLPVVHSDLSALPKVKQEQELNDQIKRFIEIPFDLEEGPLFKLYSFKISEACTEILIVLHHIIGDAWSLSLINTEISATYQLLAQGANPKVESLNVQYKDFARWQRNQPIKENDIAYWKRVLTDELPVLDLPKKDVSVSGSFQGRVYKRQLSQSLREQLQTLSKEHNTTMYVLMLAVFKVLLSKYNRHSDVVIGSPFSNRDTPQLEKLIGFFNETLVLRTDADNSLTFRDILERVKKTTLDALSHKNVPFDLLVNEISPVRKAGENPFFQAMFLYNTAPEKLDLGPDITIEEEMLDLNVSKFELTLFVNELEEGLEIVFEYNSNYDDQFIEAMADHFDALMHGILEKPESPVSEISVYSSEMMEILTKKWAGKRDESPAWKSIQELITSQIGIKKESLAVVFGDMNLTYEKLGRWSDQVAQELISQGIGKNDFVGLFTPRSLEMVVGILGILKAGAAYLPLDPDYPQERLEFMLLDANSAMVLYHPDLENQLFLGDRRTIPIHFDPKKENLPKVSSTDQLDDFAYVIYTSGSTGKPKGVPVTHRNLIHSTTARFEFYEDEMRSFLLLSSFSFDSSIVGIFWSLCAGGTLVLPPKRIEQDIEALSEIIFKERVTHTLMLPSLYQVLLSFASVERLVSLKAVMVAGEACSTQLKTRHFNKLPETRLYNEYGPTEASVWCIAHEIVPGDDTIPIGRPIQNTSAYILDDYLQPVPTGATGELYIGGLGVTKGYLNREQLTEERFLPNPFGEKEERLYRTGDLARFGTGDKILFLGRVDQQVKIRGFRVELEEIRDSLLQEPIVSEAVVKVHEDEVGNKLLLAWVESTETGIANDLRDSLRGRLPEYMVPTKIYVLERLPKLPNGKLDINRLEMPETGKINDEVYMPATNPKETLLVSLWEEVLPVDRVGIDDNFFDIGGDSIMSIQIVAKARQAGLKIGPTDIFTYQRIRLLAVQASYLENETDNKKITDQSFPIQFPLSYQQQAFLLHSLQSSHDQGLLHLEFKIKGEVNCGLMQEAWQKVAELHPAMRTSFHWEDTDAPHQVIHERAVVPWNFLDLSQENEKTSAEQLKDFKKKDLSAALDLQKPGGGRITLIKINATKFLLCWTCHHILVDGWSCAIIFKDSLDIYQSLTQKETNNLGVVPSFKEFLDWRSTKDKLRAETFWQGALENTKFPLFSDYAANTDKSAEFLNIDIQPKREVLEALYLKVRQERLTLNTVLQGLWMLTLSHYFGEKKVSVGLTVSGRASDFIGIDRVSGLLMNVLPFRTDVDSSESLVSWLQKLQLNLNELKEFEHTDSDEIQAWAKGGNRPFFDSLFVFGNFMGEKLRIGDLEVDEFKGDFSTTFPLTIRVNPGSEFAVNCRYDASIVAKESAHWLMQNYQKLINRLIEDDFLSKKLESIVVEKPLHLLENSADFASDNADTKSEFSGTQNATQLALLKLWENVIGIQLIGIHDNYFELGGTSLGAISLFTAIEKQFAQKLSPTVLINRPTIAQLAELLSTGTEDEVWSSIIPMKTSGDKQPLFCLHSGGAHVLFYQGLAKHISEERPVYAIQPTGIDGEEEHHESITEMASHYISEMQKIQPTGPYHLMGTCFGNAVGVEMSHQLEAMGERLAVLYVVDSAPAYIEPPSPNGERKPLSRMLAMIKKGNWNGIQKKFRNRYIRFDKKIKAKSRSEQEIELDEIVDTLNDVYVNYTWRPVSDKVVLIRSTEFSQRKDKTFHLERWQFLAGQELEVYEVNGHHLTLFEEPEVKGLAQKLSQHLSELAKA